MDGQTIFILCMIALPFAGLLVYGITTRPKIQVGTATVESHRLELARWGTFWGNNWNSLVTFRFPDGETLELYTTREEYEKLEDGQSGVLTWDGEHFMDFVPDIPA